MILLSLLRSKLSLHCLHSGGGESVSTPSSDVQLSESSDSDLSVSLTQSELEEDLPQGGAAERKPSSGGNDDHNQHRAEPSLHSDVSRKTPPAVTLERYRMSDIRNLLHMLYFKSSIHNILTHLKNTNKNLSGCCHRGVLMKESGEDTIQSSLPPSHQKLTRRIGGVAVMQSCSL